MLKIISLVFVGLELLLFLFESDLFSWNNQPKEHRHNNQWK